MSMNTSDGIRCPMRKWPHVAMFSTLAATAAHSWHAFPWQAVAHKLPHCLGADVVNWRLAFVTEYAFPGAAQYARESVLGWICCPWEPGRRYNIAHSSIGRSLPMRHLAGCCPCFRMFDHSVTFLCAAFSSQARNMRQHICEFLFHFILFFGGRTEAA